MAIVLKNATYIDWEDLELFHANIMVDEGVNGKIGFLDSIENLPSDYKLFDCTGKFVTKSFAVGHHHVYSALARGMPAPKKSPETFPEILKYIWWKLDKALDEESIRASALVTAIACAKAGSTFVIDHHASPGIIDGSLDIIAKTFDEVGIGHLLCYEITDRYGNISTDESLFETDRYLQTRQGLVGLHASLTLGNESLRQAADLMEKHNSGIHIHVAEDTYDQKDCLEKYSQRVVERLNEFGLLDSNKSILGHCLHLSDYEKKLIRNSNVWIVENMESNLKNNVGYFNGEGLGDNIMLGTDGMHSDMIRSAQAAYFVGQRHDKISFTEAYDRFRNVHKYLELNSFKGDGENNLVVIDYPTPTPFTSDNFLGHFIFGLSSTNINDVISDGKLIVKDRIIQTVNESEVVEFTREQAKKLWERMSR